MGQIIYFSDAELRFLQIEALEDVPDTHLSNEEKLILQHLKLKFQKAVSKIN